MVDSSPRRCLVVGIQNAQKWRIQKKKIESCHFLNLRGLLTSLKRAAHEDINTSKLPKLDIHHRLLNSECQCKPLAGESNLH